MKLETELEMVRSLGKDIKDFYQTVDAFSQQYMLFKYRQFAWQFMWNSGKFANWPNLEYEWNQVRQEHVNEIEWYWQDATTLTTNADPESVLMYIQTNPYVETAYELMKEWLNEEGYKARL